MNRQDATIWNHLIWTNYRPLLLTTNAARWIAEESVRLEEIDTTGGTHSLETPFDGLQSVLSPVELYYPRSSRISPYRIGVDPEGNILH